MQKTYFEQKTKQSTFLFSGDQYVFPRERESEKLCTSKITDLDCTPIPSFADISNSLEKAKEDVIQNAIELGKNLNLDAISTAICVYKESLTIQSPGNENWNTTDARADDTTILESDSDNEADTQVNDVRFMLSI